ncbi:MAG TPA: ECF transporter S component [Candidatus Pygmaiobacter gallistercoris]|nr:ECF transporter S component [Candidatus Pygmaiobacter gallistercoris]
MAKSTRRVRNLAVTGMLSAVGCVLMMFDFPLPMLIPSFVKMDFSELPALLASFSIGPVSGIMVCLLKNVLSAIFHGSTLGIGEVCNFLMGAVFTGVAGLIYKRNKTRKTAIIGSLVGAVVMAIASVPINFFFSYPVYAAAFGGMEAIIAAYQAINPNIGSLLGCLIVFNLPFTLVKGLLTSLLTFLVYKPLSPILHGRSE